MKVLGFVVLILGAVIFWIGLLGSQHAVFAMITGQSNIKPSGLPVNPSGPGVNNPQQAQYTAYVSGPPQGQVAL